MGESNMIVEVKLYHYHDLDLVYLYRNGNISFCSAAKTALKAFVNQDFFVFEIAEPSREIAQHRTYRFRIKFDNQEDKEVIDMLNKISKGCRNNFIKEVLRNYIPFTMTSEYVISHEDISYFNERFSSMYSKREKRILKKEKTRSKKTKEVMPKNPGPGKNSSEDKEIKIQINPEQDFSPIEKRDSVSKKIEALPYNIIQDSKKQETPIELAPTRTTEQGFTEKNDMDLTSMFMDMMGI